MNLLVTGAAGFIGSNICEYFLGKKHKIIGVDNFNDFYPPKIKEYNLKSFKNNPNFKLCKTDILDTKSLEDIFRKEKPDAIIHMAAWAGVTRSIKDPIPYVRNNIEGTTGLAELAVKYKAANFIFASTSSIYGANPTPFSETMNTDRPLAPYPASKKACEVMLYTYSKNFNLPVTIFRIFNPLGPRQRPDLALTQLLRSCLYQTEFFKYQDSDSTGRDYTYILHLLEAMEKILLQPMDYEIFNIGNSSPVTLGKLIETCEEVTGKKANVVEGNKRQGEMKITFANIEKAKKMLSYNPTTPVKESIRIYYEWFIKQEEWYKRGNY